MSAIQSPKFRSAAERGITPLSRKTGRARVLVNAIQRLSLTRSMDEVQQIVVVAARRLTGADGATFVLRDEGMCHYADHDAISPLWKGQRFPLESCISGWAMINRQAVVIKDIYADQRIPHDAYRPTFVKSLAMVPIRTMDPVGAIGNYWADEHVPSDEDLELLTALADSTAVALENVRMLDKLDYQVRLLHTLAHEVRNPLGAAQMLMEMLHDDLAKGELEADAGMVKAALAEAMKIVSEQLEVAKLDAGALRVMAEDVDVAQLLAGVHAGVQGLRKPGVALVLDCDRGAGRMHTDPRLARQMLRNLLTNAMKFTDSGEVRLTAIRPEPGTIVFRVSDTGIGIPREDQSRIFDEFAQVDNAQEGRRKGTGLGLALVRRLSDALGGQVEVASEPGVGSTFTITLPG